MTSKSKSVKNKNDEDTRIFQYNTVWEKLPWAQGWLTKSKNHKKQAHCIVCNKDYRAHCTDLQTHSKGKSHLQNMECIHVKQNKISDMCNLSTAEDKKIRDLKLSVYLACHSSIRSTDHLCEILNNLNLKDLKLHRTKCTNLLKYVIAPNFLNELVEDIGDMPYSLIVDESTSFKNKYLCLCIKYFSINQNRIISDYLGLIEVENADANTLHILVIDFLNEIRLHKENLIGLGTDGGLNLCGKNHSLYTLLKSSNPKLQLVKCVCHALNLASSTAADEFPSSVEYLVREVYNWFSNSPKRKAEYKALWDTLNVVCESSNEVKKEFHAFVKLADTRWLARYNVVKVIMEHYLELQTFFTTVIKKEKCYTARQLCSMLNDVSNYLFLRIVKPILYELNDVNLSFQRENVDASCAYDDLVHLITLLAKKILKPTCLSKDFEQIVKELEKEENYLHLDKVEFGIEYDYSLLEYKNQISNETKYDIETRAKNYIKILCIELSKRLPENLKYFQRLKVISPTFCLSSIRPKFAELPFLDIFAKKSELGLMENQYNKLLNVNWSEVLVEKQIVSTYEFWAKTFVFKNAGGNYVFRELASFVITILSLPSSNAVVERVFSVMNSVRTKFRNRMMIQLLDSILRIKMHFYANKICCKSFVPSTNMLKDFNSKVLYSDKYENVEAEDHFDESEDIEVQNLLSDLDCPCISLSEF